MRKLTIGIPAYNCRNTIESCIKPLLAAESLDLFSIIILVSESSDGTMKRLQEIVKSNKNADIKIVDDGPVKGVESALWRLVEICETDWIWMLSGDDVPVDGWFNLVYNIVNTNYHMAVYQFIRADEIGRPLFHYCNMKTLDQSEEWTFNFPIDKKKFLSKIKTTDAIFSFISNVVFRKSMWQATNKDSYLAFKGTNFMHSMRLLANINNDTKLKVSGSALIFQRGGESTFSKGGLIQRALMSYHSFGQPVDIFDRSERFLIKSAADREYPWYRCIKIVSRATDKKLIKEFLALRFSKFARILFYIIFFISNRWILNPAFIKIKRLLFKKY